MTRYKTDPRDGSGVHDENPQTEPDHKCECDINELQDEIVVEVEKQLNSEEVR